MQCVLHPFITQLPGVSSEEAPFFVLWTAPYVQWYYNEGLVYMTNMF